jgi:TonB family protein
VHLNKNQINILLSPYIRDYASKNNFKVIKLLNENYPELLDISRFIIVNNYKWDESLTGLIAFNGDLNKFLEDHLNYPEAAKSAGIEGRVVVQFVVNTDGSISDALIVKHLGAGCEEEALRVIKSMPKWKPGKQNGAAIRVLYKQPISFILQ